MTELEVYIREGFGVVDPTELAKISTLFTYSKLEKGDFLLQ
ncbi:hypothetical protein [Brumimicrobium aurantiacum]|nr:hypothetical protein [Brumimicrobium aurantiacum]